MYSHNLFTKMDRSSRHVYSTNKHRIEVTEKQKPVERYESICVPLPLFTNNTRYRVQSMKDNNPSITPSIKSPIRITTYGAMISQYMNKSSNAYEFANNHNANNQHMSATIGETQSMNTTDVSYTSPNINGQLWEQTINPVDRCVYPGYSYPRQHTNTTERTVSLYGSGQQYPTTMLRPIMPANTIQNLNSDDYGKPEYNPSITQNESHCYSNAIPTINHIIPYTADAEQERLNAISEQLRREENNRKITQEETEYPHLALDLSKIKNNYDEQPEKSKQPKQERRYKNTQKDVIPETKILMGKPRYPYTAQFNDPVEKELERWHNKHSTSIKWERMKRGVYSANNQEVKLVKLNGGLYVKGATNNNKLDHIPIDKFVQKIQHMNNNT